MIQRKKNGNNNRTNKVQELLVDTPKIARATAELRSPDSQKRSIGLNSLISATRDGDDTTSAIPLLVNIIEEGLSEDCLRNEISAAFDLIQQIAIKKGDISGAIPVLAKAFRNNTFRSQASICLELAAESEHCREEVIEIFTKGLKHPNWETRLKSIAALNFIAYKDIDITKALPALIEALGDRILEIRIRAKNALLGEAKNNSRAIEILGLLKNENAIIEEAVKNLLIDCIKEQRTIEKTIEVAIAALKEEHLLCKKRATQLISTAITFDSYHNYDRYIAKAIPDLIENLKNPDLELQAMVRGILRLFMIRGSLQTYTNKFVELLENKTARKDAIEFLSILKLTNEDAKQILELTRTKGLVVELRELTKTAFEILDQREAA